MTPPAGPILVVDDYEANSILAIRLLEKLGYPAVSVRNGLEAVQATAGGAHPLVLMDCQMPVMDGFAAARAIRARESGGHRLPIIAMTATATEPHRGACLDAGMDDILTKPVMIDVLAELIARWHPVTGGALWDAQASQGKATGAGARRELDAEVLRRLGHDLGAEPFSRFLEVYLRELPERQATIVQAVENDAAEALRLAAHALKSPSAAVGAAGLASLCAALEVLGREGRTERAGAYLQELQLKCRAVTRVLEDELAVLRA